MKNLITLFLLVLVIPVFGQTKADLVECLELMFGHPEFENAYNNSYDVNGAFVLITGKRVFNRSNVVPIYQVQQTLVPDDFYDSDYNVKVVRENELESLGIPEYSVIEIIPAGKEDQLFFRASTTIRDESTKYNYNYQFIKNEDSEWEVNGSSIVKERAVITDW